MVRGSRGARRDGGGGGGGYGPGNCARGGDLKPYVREWASRKKRC